jgi:serine/threonine-protein kinase
MTLNPGTTLGSFEISGLIGVGGMGEVYRALDKKLGREVAIKVLPEEFAEDVERLARFEREAKLLAALDHANIASVFELQEVEGVRFLVMQLVEGQTLADRIAAGPIPVDEALPIFAQIAAALESAHEHGVIHRDLKPANIKITAEGQVKVLDFGLAKAFVAETSASASPEKTQKLDFGYDALSTGEGKVLGTPAYMSPEQGSGRQVDKRADIWAYGCCLYEALTGKRPFQGLDATELMADIIKGEPRWDALPPDTPPRVRVLLWRCLQKNPQRRLRDIGEARFEIGETSSDPSAAIPALGATVDRPGISRTLYIMTALAMLALGVLATSLVFWNLKSTQSAQDTAEREPIRRYTINLSPDAPLKPMDALGGGTGLALSPDGLHLVYVASTSTDPHLLYHRQLDRLADARPLAGTENALAPFFSPNSQWIGFFTQNKLKKVSVQGGPPITLCDISAPLGASWERDGTIVFASAPGQGLKRISADGGPVQDLMPESFMADQEFFMLLAPDILPGDKSILFNVMTGLTLADFRIAALSLETGEMMDLAERAAGGYYPTTGHLLSLQEKVLIATPFDPDALEVTGPAVPVTEDNMQMNPGVDVPTLFALSAEGTLVYVPRLQDPGGISPPRTLVWVDREGNEEPLAAPPRAYRYVVLSPDGNRVAVLFADDQDKFGRGDIWILDLTREPITQQRLTFDPQGSYHPNWTRDSRRVIFNSLQDDTWSLAWKAASGTGPIESLYTSSNFLIPQAWSINDSTLLFIQRPEALTGPYDIWALSLKGEPVAHPLLAGSYDEEWPVISPDGRWLAYVSDETGRMEVYVRPFPHVDADKWLVSSRGGGRPFWGPDSRELFYQDGVRMLVVTIETEPTFAVGNPTPLFETSPYYLPTGKPYDISPDGQRFLMIKEDRDAVEAAKALPITELIVVDNWDDLLLDIAPTDPE